MAAERTILADLRLGLRPRLLLAILGVTLCFYFDNLEGLRNCSGNTLIYVENSVTCVMYFFFNSFSFGGLFTQLFAPMLAAVPLACAYCTEHQGGLTVYQLTRCGRKTYVRSKFLGAALLGGLTLFGGGALFILVLRSFLPIVTPQKLLESDWIPYFDALNSGDGGAYLAIVLYLSFLGGCLWGSAGLWVSAYLPSPYVAISAPFVFRFLMTQADRMLGLPPHLRLDLLLSARASIGPDWVTLAATTAAVFALIWIFYRLFSRRIERGLQNGF